MGSLMAGWDSHVPDPRTVKHQRNRSLTREDIDSYWKSKKQTEEEEHAQIVSKETGAVKSYQRSSSVPLSKTEERLILDEEADDENEDSLQNLILKNGWWTSSSSAFLNEPPVNSEEGKNRHNKYASQFPVADTDASKPHDPGTGISTHPSIPVQK